MPLPYWELSGQQADFRTWWMRFKNFIFWMNNQCGPANALPSEYKNHLLFSLFGAEGMAHFASNPWLVSWIRLHLTLFQLK